MSERAETAALILFLPINLKYLMNCPCADAENEVETASSLYSKGKQAMDKNIRKNLDRVIQGRMFFRNGAGMKD